MNQRIKFAFTGGVVAAFAAGAWIVGGGMGFASTQPSHRPVTCTVPSISYATINSAVADTKCAIVSVAAGKFPENVVINRSLTLQGANAGQDARGRRPHLETVISGGDLAAITINANDVTIDGFTINGPSDTGLAAFVMQLGNSGETIQNNIVANPGRAASITTDHTTFRRNLVKNTSTAQDGFQNNSRGVTGLTFDSNSFSGATPSGYNADITVIEGKSSVTVTDNKSTGDGTLIALFKTNGARITDNTVTGAGGSSAIYIGGANTSVTVTGNTVSGAGAAVKVANAFGDGVNSRVTISRNTLRNNLYGVNVGSAATSDSVQISRNSITGNSTDGVFNDPAAGKGATATCNWWGSPSGPGPVARGHGDNVSSTVTFKPWLTSANLNGFCR